MLNWDIVLWSYSYWATVNRDVVSFDQLNCKCDVLEMLTTVMQRGFSKYVFWNANK